MSGQRCLLGLLALTGLLGSVAVAQSERGRLRSARVECDGPLSGVRLTWPDGEGSEVALNLTAGERRTLEIPIAARPGPGDAVPLVVAQGAGSARFIAWDDSLRLELEARWARLPAGLRLRARPPAPDGGPGALRVPAAALLLAAAGFLAVLRFRARARVALACGVVSCALVFGLAAAPRAGAGVLELLDGEGPAWILARCAHGLLDLQGSEPGLLVSAPADAELAVNGLGTSSGTWQVRAPGADLWILEPVGSAGPTLLQDGTNALGSFSACWQRQAGGDWSFLGAWPEGAAWPAPAGEYPAPPAAWIAGLPAGRGLFLGRLERPLRAASSEAWVRVVGFEP